MTKGLPARYAKFITAVIGQGLVFAQYEYGAGNKWVTLATACAGALGVLAVPNAPKPAVEVGSVGPRIPPPAPQAQVQPGAGA